MHIARSVGIEVGRVGHVTATLPAQTWSERQGKQ